MLQQYGIGYMAILGQTALERSPQVNNACINHKGKFTGISILAEAIQVILFCEGAVSVQPLLNLSSVHALSQTAFKQLYVMLQVQAVSQGIPLGIHNIEAGGGRVQGFVGTADEPGHGFRGLDAQVASQRIGQPVLPIAFDLK